MTVPPILAARNVRKGSLMANGVKLGDKVSDIVSGFEGIAQGKAWYLNGCVQIGVQPRVDKDGGLPEARWFDEPQLTVIEVGAVVPPAGASDPGGPAVSVPVRHSGPSRSGKTGS